jgi:hypothetical protein
MLVSLLGISFNPEDRHDIFLRNVGLLSMVYKILHPRRQNCAAAVVSEILTVFVNR